MSVCLRCLGRAPPAKLHQVGSAHAGHHNFGHKVADGCCRLLGLQLSQDVTLVLRPAGSLLGHKSKDSSGTKNFFITTISCREGGNGSGKEQNFQAIKVRILLCMKLERKWKQTQTLYSVILSLISLLPCFPDVPDYISIFQGYIPNNPRYQPSSGQQHLQGPQCGALLTLVCPPPVLWVQATVGDGVDGVVAAEEQLPLIVCEGDALCRNLEVHNSGSYF